MTAASTIFPPTNVVAGTASHTVHHNNSASILTLHDAYLSFSASLAAQMVDKTGTAGSLVFSNSPSIVTPTITSPSFSYNTGTNGYISIGAPTGSEPLIVLYQNNINQWAVASRFNNSNFEIRKVSGAVPSPATTFTAMSVDPTSGSTSFYGALQVANSAPALTAVPPFAGYLEFDGKAPSFTTNVAASSRGILPVTLFTSNTSALTLNNVATAQNIFPSANDTITLAANTTYELELWFSVSTTGATSNALQLGFAKTGTLTSIGYMAHAAQNATSAVTITAANNVWVATDASTAITAAVATATYRNVLVKGLVRSGTSGTFIPQVTYSAAPGASPTVAPNAYMKLVPLGSDTTANTSAWF